jgi:hypothetical protein
MAHIPLFPTHNPNPTNRGLRTTLLLPLQPPSTSSSLLRKPRAPHPLALSFLYPELLFTPSTREYAHYNSTTPYQNNILLYNNPEIDTVYFGPEAGRDGIHKFVNCIVAELEVVAKIKKVVCCWECGGKVSS